MYSAFAAWGTLNTHRVASPLMRLVEGEEKWEALTTPRVLSLKNWGGNESNRNITSVVLKARANDRHTTSPLPQ
ncbi:hypothetical protein TNCV_4456581 [Trichonephila clavipes]|nr:hypothetical protein TNCV_4456581 [Trichonephila clavipes]